MENNHHLNNTQEKNQTRFKISNNSYTEDEREIVNLFANDLELLFKKNTDEAIQPFENSQTNYSSDPYITKLDLENAIKKLNNNAYRPHIKQAHTDRSRYSIV